MKDNLWAFVDEALRAAPEQTAWICRLEKGGERLVTYEQVHRSTLIVAAELRRRGVGAGDRVGVMAPNGPEWTAAAFAVWKVGATLTPIHVGNSDYEIERQIEATDPRVILSHQRSASDRDVPIGPVAGGALDEREAELSPPSNGDDEAVSLYTSGSTGNPKVVRLSHANLLSNVTSAAKYVDLDPDDRFLALLPFSHIMGLLGNVLLAFKAGATLVAPKVLAAAEILAALQENRVTVLIAVPRLYRNVMLGLEKRLAQAGPLQRAYIALVRGSPLAIRRRINAPIRARFGGNLKCWVSGGSRLDPEIKRYFLGLGISLRQGYGLTETSPLVSVQEHFDPVMDSVGKPIENVRVRVADPDANGCGELLVRGPNVMLGYADDDQTREVMDGEWFRTGDVGRIDAAGNIVLTGRCKRLIVTESGKNVYPEELEIALERDAFVKEAAVLEVDMRPVAVLAMEGDDPEAEARRVLKEFNALVSGHNRIARFALLDGLPRTPLGKTALHALPALFEEHEVVRKGP